MILGLRGHTRQVFNRRDFEEMDRLAQQSPAVAKVCYPFSRKHRRYWAVNRREFITLAGGAATWPLVARAQIQPKMLRVGFVGVQPRESPVYGNFLKRMAELGYQEGRNFAFEYIQT